MTQRELKKKLIELVQTYFGSATVAWGRVKKVSPNVPLILLSMGSIKRHYQPITESINGVPINCYASQTALQIDLYTKGYRLNDEMGVTATYENTAVNDLIDFLNFIGSAYVDHWSLINDVSLIADQVRDLTDLINDTSWDYRAMTEITVKFTEIAGGYAGMNYEGGIPIYDNGNHEYDTNGNPLDEDGNILPDKPKGPPAFTPNPSGGGTEQLADDFTGWFEQVENPEQVKEMKKK